MTGFQRKDTTLELTLRFNTYSLSPLLLPVQMRALRIHA